MPSSGVLIAGWWDHGEAGSTWLLTLTDNSAFVVLTFLALLITTTLKHFWRVLGRFIYMFMPEDYHNVEKREKFARAGCTTFALEILKNWADNRRQTLRPPMKSLLVLVVSGVYMLAYVALPAITAYLLTNQSLETPTVLSSGSTCEILKPAYNDFRSALTVRNANLTLASSEYYQNCYQQGATVNCKSNLAVDRLEWFLQETDCPFTSGVCVNSSNPYSQPERYQTPLLSMHQLGINTKSKLRFRKRLSCAVLNINKFRIQPGRNGSSATDTLSFGLHPYYTYDVHNLSAIAPGYRITTIPQNAWNDTDLDSRLQRQNGFVTVIMLQAPDIYYPIAMDDLMFSAHKSNLFLVGGLLYSADNLVNVAACVDQYQICNNATALCGDWESAESIALSSELVLESEEDKLAFFILEYALSMTSIEYTLSGRGASALLAQRSLNSQTQEKIHRDQWRQELQRWFGVSLAKLQLGILSIGVATPFLSSDDFTNELDKPELKSQRRVGRMIKMREGDFTNIHLAGFVATILVCTVLLLLSLTHCVH